MKLSEIRGTGYWLAAVVALGASGCSLSIDADRKQCSKDADCTARGATFAGSTCVQNLCTPPPPDPKWACLSNPAPTGTAGTYKVKIHTTYIFPSGTVAPGVKVKVCTRLDTQCASPTNAANIPVTDANGDAEVQVTAAATGFSGFFLLEHPDLMPAYYFPNPPIRQDTEISAIQMAYPFVVAGLTDKLQQGAKVLPDRGIVLINAFDCTGKAAEGVSFVTEAADDQTISYYVVQGSPVHNVTATDSTGFGGFINMPATTFALTGRVEATGADVTKLSLTVYAGAITYSRILHDG